MNPTFYQFFSLKDFLTGENKKVTIIILVSTILIVTWKYYGSPMYYQDVVSTLNTFPSGSFYGALYSFSTALFLFGAIPLLVIRFVLHESFSSYGITLGDWKFGLTAMGVMVPVMVLLSYPSASDVAFRLEYPVNKDACISVKAFFIHTLIYGLYYIGYEILMRGFIQFGLRNAIGDWYAVLVQTSISCLFHIDKPSGEIYSSIIGGVLWGIVVFRSRSLLYVFITHWILGVSLDYFICFG